MRDAAEHYGFTPNRSGFISCPFHDEKTASLKLYENSFYCFGCGAGGDVITFVAKLFDIRNSQAALRINEDFGLCLSSRKKPFQARSEILRKKAEKEKELEKFRSEYLSKCDEFRRLNEEMKTAQGFRRSEITARLEYLDYYFENTDWR